jgi:hypothetical protein
MEEFFFKLMQQGPQKMNIIYEIALQQAIPARDEEEKMNIRIYMKILGIVVIVSEPFSPNSINEILSIRNAFDIIKDLQSVLDCRDPDDPIRFLHPTFREFLLIKTDPGIYHVDERVSHFILSHACLAIMNKALRYDICGLSECMFDGEDPNNLHKKWLNGEGSTIFYKKRLNEHTTALLRYSCRFWIHHLLPYSAAPSIDKSFIPKIGYLFLNNLLDWIYIASCMGTVNELRVMLRKIELAQPVGIRSN